MSQRDADQPLADALRADPAAALPELARRYEPALLGLAYGWLGGDRELACDAVQNMWVRVLRHGRGFNGRSGLRTWLYRILVNECHSIRWQAWRAERHIRLPASDSRGRVPQAGNTGSETTAPSPSDGIEQQEGLAELQRAVKALPEDQRSVVLLCYHADLRHEEAAEILQIPLGTLKSRLHAVLQALRARLRPEVTV
jgi:RNA polymerase sigma-70 factor (ECF subfamily)